MGMTAYNRRMSRVRSIVVVAAMLLVWGGLQAHGAAPAAAVRLDSDADGLDDALEQQLLDQFAPRFMVSPKDCSGLPAEFAPNLKTPTVAVEDGTIYGQAFPSHSAKEGPKAETHQVELHYYHLWRQDCGEHGHPLDTEHVAVLIQASGAIEVEATWKALYWYAAAHEQTVCDVSQIARASTLRAEDKGAQVWISPGKHASYLDARLCQRGCGADVCEAMVPLQAGRVINLGEPGHPMNASLFISSSAWPLAFKMEHTDFPAEPVGRLERLAPTEIAWFRPGRHPVQGVIAISDTTESAIAKGAGNATSSVGSAGDATSDAISVASDSTGNALGTGYHQDRACVGNCGAACGQGARCI